jgi:hypothetical protein
MYQMQPVEEKGTSRAKVGQYVFPDVCSDNTDLVGGKTRAEVTKPSLSDLGEQVATDFRAEVVEKATAKILMLSEDLRNAVVIFYNGTETIKKQIPVKILRKSGAENLSVGAEYDFRVFRLAGTFFGVFEDRFVAPANLMSESDLPLAPSREDLERELKERRESDPS